MASIKDVQHKEKEAVHLGLLFSFAFARCETGFRTSQATLFDLSTPPKALSAVGVYVRHRRGGILRHFARPTAK
jgi:hypothetical protein